MLPEYDANQFGCDNFYFCCHDAIDLFLFLGIHTSLCFFSVSPFRSPVRPPLINREVPFFLFVFEAQFDCLYNPFIHSLVVTTYVSKISKIFFLKCSLKQNTEKKMYWSSARMAVD